MTTTRVPTIGAHLDELAQQPVVVMATVQPDGRPQLSLVRPWTHEGVIDLTLTEPRIKTRNLRRDPRVALLAATPDDQRFVVVEGLAELSPVSTAPADSTGRYLAKLYRALAGEHPDWDDYYDTMVRDQRLVAHVTVTHTYEGGSNA